MLITDADRPAAFRLLGVQPAAEWCWTNTDIAEALTHGVDCTTSGLRIMRPKRAEVRDDRIVFTGGWYGEHSVLVDDDAERVLAHWSGYVEAS